MPPRWRSAPRAASCRRGPARPAHQLAGAIRATLAHGHGALRTEGALEAADEREISVGHRRLALLAGGTHLERHAASGWWWYRWIPWENSRLAPKVHAWLVSRGGRVGEPDQA